LLDDGFGTRVDRAKAKNDLALELGIPTNAKVVLGCGTIDLRKGIDHFASAARALIRNHAAGQETHFVWLGGGPRHRHSPFHYVTMDLQRSGIEDRVHFVGERANVEPYFMAADAALMMSREDPFPCVVHEAMACGLPMITFSDAGGAPEALADDAGIIVPYGDTDAVGRELHRLFNDVEHARKISTRAIQRVRNVYSFAQYAAHVGELLETAAGVDLGFAPTLQQRAAA
jgi:glycosyltransferase involved in cell wall biosynthesis